MEAILWAVPMGVVRLLSRILRFNYRYCATSVIVERRLWENIGTYLASATRQLAYMVSRI